MATAKTRFAKAVQLTVYIDNRKGTLAALTAFLAKHDVMIQGLTLADTEGHGHVRLIVGETEKARQLIEDSGELVSAREVLVMRTSSHPREFSQLLRVMADRNVNIEYGYSACASGGQQTVVLVPSDMAAALDALAAAGAMEK